MPKLVTRAAIARLYSRNTTEIIIVNHDTALAIKVSFPRPQSSGSKETATFVADSNTRRCWDCKCQIDVFCESAFGRGISHCEIGRCSYKTAVIFGTSRLAE
jgi:hypothetical protein